MGHHYKLNSASERTLFWFDYQYSIMYILHHNTHYLTQFPMVSPTQIQIQVHLVTETGRVRQYDEFEPI